MLRKHITQFIAAAFAICILLPHSAGAQTGSVQQVEIDPDSIPPNFSMNILSASGAVYSLESFDDFTRALIGVEQNDPILLFGTAYPNTELRFDYCCPSTTKTIQVDSEGNWDVSLDIEKRVGEQYLQIEEVGVDRDPILIDLAVDTYEDNQITFQKRNTVMYRLKIYGLMTLFCISVLGIAWAFHKRKKEA